MYYGFYGPYPLLMILSIALSVYASARVNRNYRKYARIYNKTGLSGFQVARKILDANGLYDVPIEMQRGVMTDHYDPSRRVVRLSQAVYNDASVASASIAAHEIGHAIQHQQGYGLLKLRTAIAVPVGFASNASWVCIMLGIVLGFGSNQLGGNLIDLGIVLFAVVVLFHLVTLPVELDASRRALVQMEANGLLLRDEIPGAKKMLKAAAFTYLAALAVSLMELLRLLALRSND